MDPPPSQDHPLSQLCLSLSLSSQRKLVHSLNSSQIPPSLSLSLYFNITSSSFAHGSLSGCLSTSLSLHLLSWGVALSLCLSHSPLPPLAPFSVPLSQHAPVGRRRQGARLNPLPPAGALQLSLAGWQAPWQTSRVHTHTHIHHTRTRTTHAYTPFFSFPPCLLSPP